jgi:hypothetical protein
LSATDPTNTGFIAQAVEKVFLELVSSDDKGYEQLNYTTVQLYGFEAIKELKAENDAQRRRSRLFGARSTS